jgi:hypothetical protein
MHASDYRVNGVPCANVLVVHHIGTVALNVQLRALQFSYSDGHTDDVFRPDKAMEISP